MGKFKEIQGEREKRRGRSSCDASVANQRAPSPSVDSQHGDSRERCAVYQFNTKLKDQLFCPKCGTSLGIDFRDFWKPKFDGYGISVRTFFPPSPFF